MNKIPYYIFIFIIATISSGNAIGSPVSDIAMIATSSVSVATDTVTHDDKDKQIAEDKALNREVDDNYSEIVNVKDCLMLAKRIQSRVDKIVINTEKESKNIDNLVISLTNIASDTASNTTINLHIENIQNKFEIVATTSDKYIKELKSIDIDKCKNVSKSVKVKVQNTKATYKSLLVADNDLKKYIKVDVKQTLIDIKQLVLSSSTNNATTSAPAVFNVSTSTNVSKIEINNKIIINEDKNMWSVFKAIFK